MMEARPDVHVLRRRDNGRTVTSTSAVARVMGLSDETVRTIENRALDALAQCMALGEEGRPITPLRLAKSCRQPMATELCAGLHDYVTAANDTAHRGELHIFASTLKPEPSSWFKDLPVGAIVGRVLMAHCVRLPGVMPEPFSRHKGMLCFKHPELFPEPIPYHGQPSFFYVDAEVARRLPPRDEYRS